MWTTAVFVGLFSLTSGAAIWPIPSKYSFGDGSRVLWIDENVSITYRQLGGGYGYGASAEAKEWTDRIISNAINRTRTTLFNQNFVPWKFHERFSNFEPAGTNASSSLIKYVSLQQTGSDPSNIMRPVAGELDESYSLSMSSEGCVNITAATSIGLLYGLTTFTQLFYQHSRGGAYTTLAPVFKPMADIYAMIDGLSYNKMNRLHWHITDAQAWPLEIPCMPDLANKGAYAADEIYSVADVRAVQDYGALLGVEVVMEFDNPGHTTSIAYSHPELIAARNIMPAWDKYAAEPPSGSLKLNSAAVSEFLEKLFDDLFPRLKPFSSYFHLGGDEVNKNAYTLDETVRSNDPAVLQPLMQKYMDRNVNQVAKCGLVPLVWEEMLLDWNLTLPSNTIIQVWQGHANVEQAVRKGYRVIAGDYQIWYLDCGYGGWVDFAPGDASAAAWPYQDYCAPRHNWRAVYSYDPLQNIPADLAHLVLGGEVHIWSEQTDEVNLHQMVWPRTSAAAEVLWSGAKDERGLNRSQITASPRLSEMRERLVARGIKAEPVRMPFCSMNGTQCVL
ncbi:glycoside hydrolase family 20 protein [Piedraia hortae CBS 480.64]|uniref:Beta-hexosaminidase n=1 Tax=Piedraia hortae CBS 480.64 TaxID=1314780 RepID=A0A6A7BXL9_9PEZI|nr:glycoside hydrolase family 20 protein [Piedraia hortae CBS 480.64]